MSTADEHALAELRREYGPRGYAIVGHRDGSVTAEKDGERPVTAASAALMKVILHDQLWKPLTGRKAVT